MATTADQIARDAEFWQPLEGGAVACDLCYRRCVLQDGQDGWCSYRGNRDGTMVLHAHGVISSLTFGQHGYGPFNALLTFKPEMPALDVGATHCTAACSFCIAGHASLHPARLPWVRGEGQTTTADPHALPGFWNAQRAMVHPRAVVDQALRLGCMGIDFETNEPLLSWEYTFDCATLAKHAGLDVTIFTNGFSTPAAIDRLAPLVDCVFFGVKGTADADFYSVRMRSAGAVPHVLESAKRWRDHGVHCVVSDVISPWHSDAEAQQRFFAWVAETLGPHTVLIPFLMSKPDMERAAYTKGLMGDRAQQLERRAQYVARARAAGLHYTLDSYVVTCHACGGELLRFFATHPWHHTQNVTAARCDHCGASVPIVTLDRDTRIKAQRAAHALR